MCNSNVTGAKTILNYEIRLLKILNYTETGKYIEAFREVQQAIDLAKQIGYELGINNSLVIKGKIFLKTGNILEAKEILNEAYKRNSLIKNERGRINTLELLSFCYLLEGQMIEAESHIRTALEYAQHLDLFVQINSCMYGLALVLFYQNKEEYALNLLENIIYNFDQKHIKNSCYFSTLLLKIKINNIRTDHGKLIQLDIFDLIEITQNRGIKYWEHISQLVEAEQLIFDEQIDKATNLLLQLKYESEGEINFEIANYLHFLLIKIEIFTNTDLKTLENKILSQINLFKKKNLIIHLMEYKLILYQLYIQMNNSHRANEVYISFLTNCDRYGLHLFGKLIEELKQNYLGDEKQHYVLLKRSLDIIQLLPRE
jgi:tetratricopeptide (TPR) repeat protein